MPGRSTTQKDTISLEGQRYSVPVVLMGRHVWVGLLGEQLLIKHAGRIVARFRT